MPLRGVKPEAIEKRLKVFLFGPAGSYKTTTAIQFPSPYLLDTERGAENDQYVQALARAGGLYFSTTDLDEIIAEVTSLLRERHKYRTLALDPITVPYNDAVERAARELAEASNGKSDGTEFGRHKAKADMKMKRLCALLLRLDMNVVVTSHAKAMWQTIAGKLEQTGTTFDAYAKLEYVFDLVLEAQKRGEDRVAIVRKSRIVAFKEGDTFPLSYDAIAERYGREQLERGAEPVKLASPEQVARLTQLVEVVKLEPGIVDKWLEKANAETFAEMPEDAIAKCIAHLESKVAPTAEPAPIGA